MDKGAVQALMDQLGISRDQPQLGTTSIIPHMMVLHIQLRQKMPKREILELLKKVLAHSSDRICPSSWRKNW